MLLCDRVRQAVPIAPAAGGTRSRETVQDKVPEPVRQGMAQMEQEA